LDAVVVTVWNTGSLLRLRVEVTDAPISGLVLD
jgi:hypothetical protein